MKENEPNVLYTYIDGFDEERDPIFDLIKDFPTTADCIDIAMHRSNKVKREVVSLEIRFFDSGISPASEDFPFVIQGPPKRHKVLYNFRTNERFEDDTLCIPTKTHMEYVTIEIPRGQKAAIQAAANQVGESINGYVSKAVQARMGLEEWPEAQPEE